MSSFVDELKREFSKTDNALIKIILINLFVFLFLLVAKVILTLSGASMVYHTLLQYVILPANLPTFAYQPWTLFSYFFAHEDLFHILFNMLFFYWFGRLINEYLGTRRLVALYVLGGIVGGITYIAIYNLVPYFQEVVATSKLLGASGAAFAVAVAASTLLPNYYFNLIFLGPIKIKYIALFYIILSFAQSIGPNAGGNLAHLGGALFGFLFIKALKGGNDLGRPIYFLMDTWEGLFKKRPSLRVTHRSKSVYQGSVSSTFTKSTKASQSYTEIPDQDEIDSILDKISKSGYESLSREEKQKLFRASQQ
jgi:membrane associated rhomboid family serine protease